MCDIAVTFIITISTSVISGLIGYLIYRIDKLEKKINMIDMYLKIKNSTYREVSRED